MFNAEIVVLWDGVTMLKAWMKNNLLDILLLFFGIVIGVVFFGRYDSSGWVESLSLIVSTFLLYITQKQSNVETFLRKVRILLADYDVYQADKINDEDFSGWLSEVKSLLTTNKSLFVLSKFRSFHFYDELLELVDKKDVNKLVCCLRKLVADT